MKQLALYTVFHLNLAYSSIEEKSRKAVIDRCYWPLLRLARDGNLPFGIESSGYTLEAIAALDYEWTRTLRALTTEGPCEFIGSGYAQIIGPLVPAEVNAANLRLGHEVYQELLGIRPRIALVNEQAYSAGMVRHYLDAGYQAIITEWNNPARYHPQWPPFWRHLPHYACGPGGEAIPLIWNDAIAFQKFQRYAHGELELPEYLEYLTSHLSAIGDGPNPLERAVFPLYGNDVEVFDYRPGRFATETEIHSHGEWLRLQDLFEALKDITNLSLIPPSHALALLHDPGAGNRLRLESPEQPIPVKKQGKYNISRWAITGRDDLGINTACWRIYRCLKASGAVSADSWRKLCYLWSSDFRTHITDSRWLSYRKELEDFERGLEGPVPLASDTTSPANQAVIDAEPSGFLHRRAASEPPRVQREGRFLLVETSAVRILLNCRRGLTVDSLTFKEIAACPLIGTLPHGYYSDIALGADYYTGHTILEVPGFCHITDLNPTEPEWEERREQGEVFIRVRAQVPTDLGPVIKTIDISKANPFVRLHFSFEWPEVPLGSFRSGIITLLPEAFQQESLSYATHNGGFASECFPVAGWRITHSEPATALVSVRQGLGATEGMLTIQDKDKSLEVIIEQQQAAVMPMIRYQEVDDRYFFRLLFSLGELDETRLAARRIFPAAFGLHPGTAGRTEKVSPQCLDQASETQPKNNPLALSLIIRGKSGCTCGDNRVLRGS